MAGQIRRSSFGGTDSVWGQDPRGPDEVYRLRVNPSDDGPLFLYVHPSVTTESGR